MGYPRSHFTSDEEYKKYRKIQNEKERKRRSPIKEKINKKEVERRSTIREKINKKEVERSKKLKIDALSNYSDGEIHCLHCGITEIDFLTIDHIAGRRKMGHAKHIKGKELYRWLKINKYPSGFQVLCWNWNQIKGKKDLEINHSQTSEAKRKRKEYYKLKNEVFRKYCGNKKPYCVCCGYNELDGLSIDHIDGRDDGYCTEEEADKLWRCLKKNKFPKGFQVLCFNCNSAKKDNGMCPHKMKT
jgi:hypothetical protein